jgi:hypothetical protein
VKEPITLTQHLSDMDSMLASVTDPQRAPEMLAVAKPSVDGPSTISFAPTPNHRREQLKSAPSRQSCITMAAISLPPSKPSSKSIR